MPVIIRPIITEKSTKEAGKNKYTFEVSRFSNKGDIRREVEEKFKVQVVSVTTLVVKGQSKRKGKKMAAMAITPWKKAVVETRGQKIDLFETGAVSK